MWFDLGTVLPIPCNSTLQPLAKIHSGTEAELLLRPARIQAASGLAIRLRSIPDNPPTKVTQFSDQLSQVLNSDFHSRAQVHRLRLVVPFRCQDNRLRRILDVQKFPRSPARAPGNNLFLPRF